MYCLGIDTSCYTTSLAAVSESFELCYDGRIMIEVPARSRGLRQSDAFFQHIRNLRLLMEQCTESIEPDYVKGISVSAWPRNEAGSYMPVFLAGMHTARTISLFMKAPVFEVSHQESHIEAGIWSSGHEMAPAFLAYHISGGTTELLYVNRNNASEIVRIGGSSDLNAGQFIDRVGVAMGMNFPCGQEMDKLCSGNEIKGVDIPISINGFYASFSGPETYIQRIINDRSQETYDAAAISKGVFLCIAKSVEKTVVNAKSKYDMGELLLVGGVASNTTVRDYIGNSSRLAEIGIKPIFSDERYSSDNAVGTAVLGMKQLRRNE
ncbi:MAG: O-sialoglycoprotein endopeptidase [Lutisporaceae bacterium]|jgi:N6-L-threonylcarbamoyladenine synthase